VLDEMSKIAEAEATEDALPEIEQPLGLLPAGPLALVKIVPARSRVERGGARRLHVLAEDECGQAIASQGVAYTWQCTDGPGQLEKADGPLAILRAGDRLAPCTVTVEAAERERRARAEAIVEVVAELPARLSADGGIPQPSFVNDPNGAWRSRLVDSRWEVNSAHRDYLTALESPKRKLRYLASLLAKEIVAHSFPSPQAGSILERMVEVLTITDQRLER